MLINWPFLSFDVFDFVSMFFMWEDTYIIEYGYGYYIDDFYIVESWAGSCWGIVPWYSGKFKSLQRNHPRTLGKWWIAPLQEYSLDKLISLPEAVPIASSPNLVYCHVPLVWTDWPAQASGLTHHFQQGDHEFYSNVLKLPHWASHLPFGYPPPVMLPQHQFPPPMFPNVMPQPHQVPQDGLNRVTRCKSATLHISVLRDAWERFCSEGKCLSAQTWVPSFSGCDPKKSTKELDLEKPWPAWSKPPGTGYRELWRKHGSLEVVAMPKEMVGIQNSIKLNHAASCCPRNFSSFFGIPQKGGQKALNDLAMPGGFSIPRGRADVPQSCGRPMAHVFFSWGVFKLQLLRCQVFVVFKTSRNWRFKYHGFVEPQKVGTNSQNVHENRGILRPGRRSSNIYFSRTAAEWILKYPAGADS